MTADPAEAAFRRARAGDFVGIDAHLGEKGSETPWQLALRAIHAMTLPGRRATMPSRPEMDAHGDHPGAYEARRQHDLLSLLELRPPSPGDGTTLADALRAFFAGDLTSAERLATEVASRARSDSAAALCVDAETIAALASTTLEEGIARARRASRMARSEGLLQQEYLANVVLARVRRREQRAYLSVRILTSLANVVPEVWQRLVGLELALAGGAPTPRGEAPLAGAADAIASGDRARTNEETARVLSQVAACVPLAHEVEDWLCMLDVEAAVHDRIRPWATGLTDASPHGIRDARRGEGRSVWVVARPGCGARRVLGAGLEALGDDAVAVRSGRRGTRTEEALSRLLLSPEGIDEPAFFETVYGFGFDKGDHAEVLRGLIHRMRAALGDAAEIERDGGTLTIVPKRALAVEDPRCEEALADRVLDRLAASNGRATAKELTTALRVPLRTVQRALGQLVEDGACHAEPDGHRTEYVVEDTTFNEPSLHRLRGKRD